MTMTDNTEPLPSEAAVNEVLRAENARLRKALEGLVDDEPCRYDHHGYCQSHFVTDPCEMAVARAVLEGGAK